MKKNLKYEVDPITPFIFPEAEILILGTFPAPKARESGFYYAHPTNQFWPLMAKLFDTEIPSTIEARKAFLKEKKIALWNICGACYIDGSKDSTITEPKINDIASAIKGTNIKQIFTSGKVSQKLYREHCMKETGIKDIYLPSTSSINKRNYPFDKLLNCHKIILEYL